MPRFRLSLTLASGERHEFEVARMPRAWKSWIMHQLPYGTEFYGCRWAKVEKVS